jgi:hypothetical protein
MKRYMVFAGHMHYPSGGIDDFVCDTENKEEAFKIAEKEKDGDYGWAHVYDTTNKEKILDI